MGINTVPNLSYFHARIFHGIEKRHMLPGVSFSSKLNSLSIYSFCSDFIYMYERNSHKKIDSAFSHHSAQGSLQGTGSLGDVHQVRPFLENSSIASEC